MDLNPYVTPHTIIKLRWTIDLNVKDETITLLEIWLIDQI